MVVQLYECIKCRSIQTEMEANKDFLTLFLIFDKIKQNVNNKKSPQYYGVTVIQTSATFRNFYKIVYMHHGSFVKNRPAASKTSCPSISSYLCINLFVICVSELVYYCWYFGGVSRQNSLFIVHIVTTSSLRNTRFSRIIP